MSLGSSPLACVVCGGQRVQALDAAAGRRAYCLDCFHGWRIERRPYAYNQTAMCALGTSPSRLARQVDFFAPFAPAQALVLEIGCATGELAAATRAALSPARYDANELSPAGAVARAKVDRLFDRTLSELLADGVLAEPYDLILMSHVHEHIEDPGAELATMAKVLKLGGGLFLEVPNGAGNRRLPIDDNSSHLHFFSTVSLARMLASQGLEAIATATDVKLDARYADSLQVLARAFKLPSWDRRLLSSHPLLANDTEIVVWGAGSLVEEILANFFDPAKIAYFVDRDPRKQGGLCLGRPVRSPAALEGETRTILVNSIDYGPVIAADIAQMFPTAAHRVVQMSDLVS